MRKDSKNQEEVALVAQWPVPPSTSELPRMMGGDKVFWIGICKSFFGSDCSATSMHQDGSIDHVLDGP